MPVGKAAWGSFVADGAEGLINKLLAEANPQRKTIKNAI
jgi:hypothetical protein